MSRGEYMRTDLKLTPEQINAIESVLAQDKTVMLIPTKDKIRIVRVRHDEVKVGPKTNFITKY